MDIAENHRDRAEFIVYDSIASYRIRYIFTEALSVLGERRRNNNRPIDWHNMDWRISEMTPMADIALRADRDEISVPTARHGEFRLQMMEAMKVVRDRLKTKNVYYIETEDMIRRVNGERLGCRKLAPNHIPT